MPLEKQLCYINGLTAHEIQFWHYRFEPVTYWLWMESARWALVRDIGWTSCEKGFKRKATFWLSFCQGIVDVISPRSGPYPHINLPKQIENNHAYPLNEIGFRFSLNHKGNFSIVSRNSGCQVHSFPLKAGLKAGFRLTASQAASSSGGVVCFILLDIVDVPMNGSSYSESATPQYLKTVQFP